MDDATAIFIKSESGDYYLYNFHGNLTREQAIIRAMEVCPEEEECWCDIIISKTPQ